MLQGEKVRLRPMSRDDLERIWQFNNDLEVELASGGDPPIPQSLARLQAEFDAEASKGGRDGARFAIDAGDKLIGHCALFKFDDTARTCELGITIGDKSYWGRGYGRDAISVLLDYAFRLRNIRRVFAADTDVDQNLRGPDEEVGFGDDHRTSVNFRVATCSPPMRRRYK